MVVKTSTFTKHIFNYLIKPNFLYHKSSIFVPKFVTEPNENVDLYSEISDFGEKIEAKDRFKFNKTKSKNSVSNRKEHPKKTPLPFRLSKINGTAPGIVNNKIRDLTILISRKNKFVRHKRNRKRISFIQYS